MKNAASKAIPDVSKAYAPGPADNGSNPGVTIVLKFS